MPLEQNGFLSPDYVRKLEASTRVYYSKYRATYWIDPEVFTWNDLAYIDSRASMNKTTIGSLMSEYLGYDRALKALEVQGISRHDPTAKPIAEAKAAVAESIVRQFERRYGSAVPALFTYEGVIYGRDYAYKRPSFSPVEVPDVSDLPIV